MAEFDTSYISQTDQASSGRRVSRTGGLVAAGILALGTPAAAVSLDTPAHAATDNGSSLVVTDTAHTKAPAIPTLDCTNPNATSISVDSPNLRTPVALTIETPPTEGAVIRLVPWLRYNKFGEPVGGNSGPATVLLPGGRVDTSGSAYEPTVVQDLGVSKLTFKDYTGEIAAACAPSSHALGILRIGMTTVARTEANAQQPGKPHPVGRELFVLRPVLPQKPVTV